MTPARVLELAARHAAYPGERAPTLRGDAILAAFADALTELLGADHTDSGVSLRVEALLKSIRSALPVTPAPMTRPDAEARAIAAGLADAAKRGVTLP